MSLWFPLLPIPTSPAINRLHKNILIRWFSSSGSSWLGNSPGQLQSSRDGVGSICSLWVLLVSPRGTQGTLPLPGGSCPLWICHWCPALMHSFDGFLASWHGFGDVERMWCQFHPLPSGILLFLLCSWWHWAPALIYPSALESWFY